jgi:DNA-binding transcriptional MerR regulator
MTNYTIKEIAELAGVTTRTLRYYDQIGLLPPAEIGGNSYRYYNQDSLLKLQQILFFRELDVPLNEIQQIMNQPDFNLESALLDHRARLQKRSQRLETLITTIDQTIANLQGDRKMTAEELFEGFDESQYDGEVQERWGDSWQYAESEEKWTSYSKEEKAAIKAEGERLTVAMVSENPSAAPDDPGVQAAIAEYHAYINQYFYSCDLAQLRGLADMWASDPRFSANYDQVRPGGAAFVREAVHIYCDRKE